MMTTATKMKKKNFNKNFDINLIKLRIYIKKLLGTFIINQFNVLCVNALLFVCLFCFFVVGLLLLLFLLLVDLHQLLVCQQLD